MNSSLLLFIMHEIQICPRCNHSFECKPGNIFQCQCYGISISEKVASYLVQQYGSCLCASCITDIKKRFETGELFQQ